MIINYENTDICQAEHTVLKDVNFQVEKGEMIYIVGQVGSGKTTLFRTIYGETTPIGGHAEVMGYDLLTMRIKKIPELRRQIGIVFQDFQLLTDRTVKENLDFVLRATGWKNKEERAKRIVEVLEQVGIPEKTNHMPYQLSGGEQQRVCIARAILNNPQLILADEPTGNLDRENGCHIIHLLNSLRESGAAVIIATHNMQWLEEIPGKVFRCKDRQLIPKNN